METQSMSSSFECSVANTDTICYITQVNFDTFFEISQYLGPYELLLLLSTCKKFWNLRSTIQFKDRIHDLINAVKLSSSQYFGNRASLISYACEHFDISFLKRTLDRDAIEDIVTTDVIISMSYANHSIITDMICNHNQKSMKVISDKNGWLAVGYAKGRHKEKFLEIIKDSKIYNHLQSAGYLLVEISMHSELLYFKLACEEFKKRFSEDIPSYYVFQALYRSLSHGKVDIAQYIMSDIASSYNFSEDKLNELGKYAFHGFMENGNYQECSKYIRYVSTWVLTKAVDNALFSRSIKRAEFVLEELCKRGVVKDYAFRSLTYGFKEGYLLALHYPISDKFNKYDYLYEAILQEDDALVDCVLDTNDFDYETLATHDNPVLREFAEKSKHLKGSCSIDSK